MDKAKAAVSDFMWVSTLTAMAYCPQSSDPSSLDAFVRAIDSQSVCRCPRWTPSILSSLAYGLCWSHISQSGRTLVTMTPQFTRRSLPLLWTSKSLSSVMRRLRPPLIARCTKTITTPQSSQSRIARFSLNSTLTEWPLLRSVKSNTVTPTPSRLVLKKSVCNSRTPALKQVPRKPTPLHQSLLASTCTTMFTRSVILPWSSQKHYQHLL